MTVLTLKYANRMIPSGISVIQLFVVIVFFIYSTFEVMGNFRTEQAHCRVNNVTHK